MTKYKIDTISDYPILEENGIALTIVNDDLEEAECITLNVLEVVSFKIGNKKLFHGTKGIALVDFNPNTMTKKEYKETIEKVFEYLEKLKK